MKSKNLPPSHQRCHHHYDNGSRCRLPIDSASEHFCGRHLDTGHLNTSGPEQREAELLALYREVMGGAKFLNSATAVNHVLDNLFRLTLLGRIPQRIASKLTTQLRASLTSIRMKRDEYRVSQDDIETLLEDIDSHRKSLENETEVESEPSELEPTGTNGLLQAETENPTPAPNRAHVAPHSSAASSASAQNKAKSNFQDAAPHASQNFKNQNSVAIRDPQHPALSRADSARDAGPRNDARVAQSANSADASSAEIFRSKDRGASQPRQIELLKAEANRPDRDPFFDFLPRADSATGNQHAPQPNETVPQDLPEFSELRAAESRRRVADLVNGVWIGPKPNEINWDQLEQQIEFAEQTKPTPYPRRRSRWQTMIG